MSSSNSTRLLRAVTTVAATAALPLTTAGVATLCVTLFPPHVPTSRDPHVLDLVFDSGPVIWATRLLLVSAALVLAVGGAFIVASTVVRTRNGDWLKRAGPFEVSETTVADLADEVYLWRSAAFDFRDQLGRVAKPTNERGIPNERATSDDDYDKL